ncbi:tetratricopeptide repeat protein [Onishia niordana]|uniref:tetratricopeptide repeat protein n=1 Tax=Onishia niordana TaxID=2508711 RepID=UPI0010A02E13|nr:tetratricopeptide repeat protein [Halomonas niordiana]
MSLPITFLAALALGGCLVTSGLAQADDAVQSQSASLKASNTSVQGDSQTSTAPWRSQLNALIARFERISTTLSEDEQAEALEALAAEARGLGERYPSQPDVLVWQGIIFASEARAKGGVSALGLAKEAREVLERAVELDPAGLRGSAYVTLGALYDRAPGWPLAFGDEATAERMFERALEIRPTGIDVHFYFAAFLEEEGRLDEARAHLKRAIDGQSRSARVATDEALREEAIRRLAKLG